MKKIILLFTIFFAVSSCFAQLPFPKSEACKKAGAKFYQGDRQGAVAILDNAIAKDPNLLDARQMRGSFRAILGDFQGAIDDYKAALALDPTAVDIYANLSEWQLFLRDYDGASATLDAAIAHGLKTEKVYMRRGDLKKDRQDLPGAMVEYQNAIAASPASPRGYTGLARAYEAKGDLPSAIAQLQTFFRAYEATGKTPKDKSVTVGNARMDQYDRPGKEPDGSQAGVGVLGAIVIGGSSPEEIEKNRNAMERALNIRSAYYALGELFSKTGDLDQALASYEKGLAMKPDDGEGHGYRAQARIAKGDLGGAIDDLSAALKDPIPWQDKNKTRGILDVLEGREDDAAKEFETFLQRFPKAKESLDKEIEEARALLTKASH
jgi:tetratricopeptide (TPR) repeat protein